MRKIILILWCSLLSCLNTFAQDTTKSAAKITISGYAEIYYDYDFNNPANHNRPNFIYSYNRANEVNLNLGFIQAAYTNTNVHATLAFMAGTYTNANLKDEQGVLKNIYEASVGAKLSKSANLWLDAGIFGSHIGYESAVGKDCWALTRNIASDNTPYFETGIKVNYTTANGKLTLAGLYLNGWQRIEREDGNNRPAGGVQVTWLPLNDLTLNYSNYLGSQGTDANGLTRFYNNFYAIWQISKTVGLTTGFDYGLQQKTHNSSKYNDVISPVAVARYQFAEKWALAGRIEYYRDNGGIFIQTPLTNGFKTTGYSANIDYAPAANAIIRLEGKIYDSSEHVFLRSGSYVGTDAVITASFAVAF